jgi:hypothetical protein
MTVILSAAKSLASAPGSDEILRYAQNDRVCPVCERLRVYGLGSRQTELTHLRVRLTGRLLYGVFI